MTLVHMSHVFFFALEPELRLSAKIKARKAILQRVGGDQQYIDDPPHLTLYLAAFRDGRRLADSMAEIVAGVTAPCVRLNGWGVFASDPLTGNTTLFAAIEPANQSHLRQLQSRVIGSIAAMRDDASTNRRYAGVWTRLSSARQQAIERSGFPYVGEDWQPHFTIASVAPAAWPTVWQHLQDAPIIAEGLCDALVLYRLEAERPVEVARWHLSRL